MSNRIIRRFSRLGIGTALLVAIYGFVLTGVATVSEYNANSPGILIFESATHKVSKKTPSGANIYAEIDGAPPPGLNELIRHRTPALYAAKAAGIGLGITVVAALAVFAFFRGLGWILGGFARD
jgi:hypothetical protein